MIPYLAVGLDESNHGRHPEIITAIFSQYKRDAEMIRSKRKNQSEKRRLIQEFYNAEYIEGRDMRFTLLDEEQTSQGNNRLYKAGHSLIIPYIKRRDIHKLQIFVDGPLNSNEKEYMKDGLSQYVQTVVCEGFIKSKGVNYQQPLILAVADAFANQLYKSYQSLS